MLLYVVFTRVFLYSMEKENKARAEEETKMLRDAMVCSQLRNDIVPRSQNSCWGILSSTYMLVH